MEIGDNSEDNYAYEYMTDNKWNGYLVPQYIPLTAAGGIVNIPAQAGSPLKIKE